ncbi:MAG: GDYXXLXY domain-containing protein, partial [Leptolyngbya sp. SIO1D8]|nr:GDYXXLXY domain-containing protein [Leptolyngbya sp. SIO1D8]
EEVLGDTNQTRFYLVLEAPEEASGNAEVHPWQPVRVSAMRPGDLAANEVALAGEVNHYWDVIYGLEAYYMPENQREAINDDIQTTQQETPEAFLVEVKVDHRGNAVPISLWVGDRTYRF